MDTKALRQKILDLAIRGKLVPQDPNDEPASVLLEKIRAEKQQMVKEGKLKAKDIKNDTIIFRGEDNLHYEQFQDGTVKCIEEEIPFEVPEGWEWERLKNCCSKEIKRGKSPKYVSKSSTLVFAQKCNTKYDGININLALYLDENCLSKYSKDEYMQDGDVVINSTGTGTLGRVGIYKASNNNLKLPIVPDSHVTIIRAWNSIQSFYIYAYMKYNQKELEGKGEGSTNQKELKPLTLKELLVPIPPKSEQVRIQEQLIQALTLVNNIENNKKDVVDCIPYIKSKILDLAIRGKLILQNPNEEPASVLLERIRTEKERLIKQGKIKRDKRESIIFRGDDNSYYEKFADGTIKNIDNEIPFDIPESWVFIRLKNICELISGRDLLPTEYNTDKEGIPYITGASNFVMGKVELARWTINPQVVTEVGDLLLTCKGTIGEMALNNFGKAHIARQIMAIRNIYNLNFDYLFLCLRFYINDLKDASKGIIPGISRKDILELIVPMPPAYYQNATVSCIKKLDTALLQIKENLN